MPPLVPLKLNKCLQLGMCLINLQFLKFQPSFNFEFCSIMSLCFIWLENCFCLWKTLHYCYNCPVLIMTLVTLQYATIILLSICFLGAGKSTLINILAGYKWVTYLLLLSIYIIKTAMFSVFCRGSWVRVGYVKPNSRWCWVQGWH